METGSRSREEGVLLFRWQNDGDEKAFRAVLDRDSAIVFALVSTLTQGDPKTVFRTTHGCFLEALRELPYLKSTFLKKALSLAVEKSKGFSAGAASLPKGLQVPPAQKKTFEKVWRALSQISYSQRALLLLRDQINLSYADISEIMNLPEKTVKLETTQARIRLREKMRRLLEGRGKDDGLSE